MGGRSGRRRRGIATTATAAGGERQREGSGQQGSGRVHVRVLLVFRRGKTKHPRSRPRRAAAWTNEMGREREGRGGQRAAECLSPGDGFMGCRWAAMRPAGYCVRPSEGAVEVSSGSYVSEETKYVGRVIARRDRSSRRNTFITPSLGKANLLDLVELEASPRQAKSIQNDHGCQ